MHIPTIGRHLFWWVIGFSGFNLKFQPWGVKLFWDDSLREALPTYFWRGAIDYRLQ